MVRARVAAGRWREIERGVYAIAGSPETWRQQLLAAALTLGPTGVAGAQSSAALFGIPGFPERPIQLVVLRPAQGKPRNGIVFQTKYLPASHCTIVDAIPVTALPRTIFDLAGHVPMGRVARAHLTIHSRTGSRRSIGSGTSSSTSPSAVAPGPG